MTFLPNGRLHVEMMPPIFVGSVKKSLISAEGRWELANDTSASVRTTLELDGGQVQSILEMVKKGGRTYLAVWFDEPGGQPLGLERFPIPTSRTR